MPIKSPYVNSEQIRDSDQRATERDSEHLPPLGRRPLPFRRSAAKSCLDRVVFDVVDDSFQLIKIPDAVVMGFGLPKRSGLSQNRVALQRRVPLETVHDPFSWWPVIDTHPQRVDPRTRRLEGPVNVARHDDIGPERIPLSCKMTE